MSEEKLEKYWNKVYYDYLEQEEAEELIDYYKNIEQENKQLKDSRDWWKDRFFGQQEYDDSHRITAIEYKKRINKAIEYINNASYFDGSSMCANDLLEILGGDDNGM